MTKQNLFWVLKWREIKMLCPHCKKEPGTIFQKFRFNNNQKATCNACGKNIFIKEQLQNQILFIIFDFYQYVTFAFLVVSISHFSTRPELFFGGLAIYLPLWFFSRLYRKVERPN